MKKSTLLSALILIVSLTGYAQFKIGVHADALLSRVVLRSYSVDLNSSNIDLADYVKPAADFKLGLIITSPLSKDFSLMAECNIVRKTGKAQFAGDYQGPNYSTNYIEKTLNQPIFIEVPLNLVFNKKISGGKIFAGLGPVLSIGVGGKDKVTYRITYMDNAGNTEITDTALSAKINFDGNANPPANESMRHFKRIEFGFNALVGYEFNSGFFTRIGYMKGFTNLFADEKSSYKTSYWSLGVGFFFKSKK